MISRLYTLPFSIMKKNFVLLCTALCIISVAAQAEVKLPNILSSHMVLQRNRPIHLWGWASPGEQVTATFHNHSAAGEADGLGKWSIYLPQEQAGGPYTLTVSGSNTITLDDILVGDVWFASGQSNMQLPLQGWPGSAEVTNGRQEIQNATHADIRLLQFPDKAAPYPQQDQPATWTLCTPESAARFSAAAYFFGRELSQKEHVPIGLIESDWGGTPADSWISMDSLGSDASLMPVFAEWAHVSDDYLDFTAMRAMEQREIAAAQAAGKPKPEFPWHPDLDSWAPSWLYNGMVSPAIHFPIKGVIWYQGETNSANERANMYERIFPALISDWRRQWQEGDFPFYFVQISSFKSTPFEAWPIIREAQRRTLKLANTAMAVTIDIGNPDNVHPADKQDVGHRLALAARALTYGETIEYSGPMYRQASIDGNKVQVWFDHAGAGLEAKGGALTGFEIAGQDKKFVPATAAIKGDSVEVSSPQVADPAYVRYGWSNAPTVNLFNKDGLPASPFTTEKDIPNP